MAKPEESFWETIFLYRSLPLLEALTTLLRGGNSDHYNSYAYFEAVVLLA